MAGSATLKEYDTHGLAWAAGFFDGEGHCASHGRGVRMGVTQAGDTTALMRFQIAVGGLGYISKPYFPKGNRKPRFQWSCTKFEHVQATMCLLWKWLSPSARAKFQNTVAKVRDAGLYQPRQQCEHDTAKWECAICLRAWHREYERTWYAKNIQEQREKNRIRGRKARARRRAALAEGGG